MPQFNLKYWAYPVLFFTITALVISDAAWNMVFLWSTTDTFMHGWFVLPLAAIMAKNKPYPPVVAQPIPLWQGAIIALLWAGVLVIGMLSMINAVQQIALIAIIPMFVVMCYGWRIAWHYRAPLVLVFFCIPVGDFLIPWLQSITADMAVFLLHASGVSVLRNGWYISIAAADFRVAEACSGINFLISTFTVAVFYSFTYMEKLHKRVVFMLMGVLVPLLANGVRVYLIIMIAHWGNVEAATGFDHLVYGWIFFFIILAALFMIGNWWQDPISENKEGGVMATSKPLQVGQSMAASVLPVSLVLAVVLVVSGLRAERDVNVIGKPVSKELRVNPLQPQFPAADSLTSQMLDGWMQYQAVYSNENVDKKMIGYQNRWFDGNIWSVKSKEKMTIHLNGGKSIPIDKWTVVGLSGNEYQLLISYCVGGDWAANIMKAKALQVKHRILLNDGGGVAYGWFSPANTPVDVLEDNVSAGALCPR